MIGKIMRILCENFGTLTFDAIEIKKIQNGFFIFDMIPQIQ